MRSKKVVVRMLVAVAAVGLLATISAVLATAQGDAASGAAASATNAQAAGGSGALQVLQDHWKLLVGIVVLVLAGGGAAMTLGRRRTGMDWLPSNMEAEVESSRFEQLLAEIQGLSLRVKGSGGKGYYRKIEQLAKIFLERIGHKDARAMSEAQLSDILRQGLLKEPQAQVLSTILERCRYGAAHESEKLDFSATDLLKDLRTIVLQVDEGPGSRHG